MTDAPGADNRDSVTNLEGLRVICIAGTGQNGATLLTRMLGSLPNIVAVGELGYLWDWGLLEDRPCGCGRPFSECPFWTKVGEVGFGSWDQVDANRIIAGRRTITSMGGRVPQPVALGLILKPGLSRTFREAIEQYAGATVRLYQAISLVAGADVVVDSMKRPSHVFAMSRQPGLDVRMLHLVRDSRGVAHSNLKWVRRQTGLRPSRKGPYRVRRPPWKASARWLWINLAFELLAASGVPTVRVRYESLVASPRLELESIARSVGIPLSPSDLTFLREDGARLAESHLVAGNRMRLRSGPVPLKVDEDWRTQMDPRDIRTVTTLTRPLLKRYGYLSRG
jgi:hypothetical protein